MKKVGTAILMLFLAFLVVSAQSGFQTVDGAATAIGIGANGSVWVVGTNKAVYNRTGNTWQRVDSSEITRVAVDPQGNPWVIGGGGAMYRRVNNAWVNIPGQAFDIGIGADGSVYHVGLSGTLFKWTGTAWGNSFGNDAQQVAVDPQGNPWTLSKTGEIARYTGTSKQVLPGQGLSIAISAKGTVFTLGADNNRIWRWTGSDWVQAASFPNAVAIAADPQDGLWVLARDLSIVRSGALDVVQPTQPTTPTPSPTGDARADFNNLVLGLPGWSAFAPERPDQNRATGSGVRAAPARGTNGNAYDCTTTPYTITETPDKIVTFNPDANVLWSGALLQGRGYKQGIGSLRELPIRQRAPLELSVNLQTAQNGATIANPTNVSVASAIGGIIDNAQRNGVQTATSISYTKTDSYSSEQLALSLGISASYLASSVKATFGFSRDVSERTVSAIFRETAYTVSVAAPQTPSSFLSSAFTRADLDAQIQQGSLGRDNIPVYVSSVTYGRMLMFSMTSTASAQELNATLDAMYRGGAVTVEGNLSASQKTVLRNSKISVVTVGGDAENARSLIATGNLSKYFERTNSLSTYRPISYEVRNLGDGSIAKLSETTNYNLTECSVLTGKKAGERWVSIVDGIYLNEPGDTSDGNIYGIVRLEGKSDMLNIPRASAITMNKGDVIGANRNINVPGVGLRRGDGRFDENRNFQVYDFVNSTARGWQVYAILLDADYTLGNQDDAIINRQANNPIQMPNPFGGPDTLAAPRITGTGSGDPGSATVIYRQKKLCNLIEDPVTKAVAPENNFCVAAATAIAQP